MIDVHVHAVPPNLPGVGPLSPLLRMSPETVATELRRQMQTAGVTHAFAMGQWIVGDDVDFSSEEGRERAAELSDEIRRAMRYSERPNRFLYGTDWPLAPMPAYRDFVRAAVPGEYHDCVFEENARLLFRLG